MAGCGLGADGAALSESERERWRGQACAWLRADLAAWAEKAGAGSADDRALARKALSRWQADPDLARLREPDDLDRLSPDERKEWLALWGDVAAVLKRTEIAE
jgi:hypothetical protein